jgi:GNAT superfamily N-acetyltransferase
LKEKKQGFFWGETDCFFSSKLEVPADLPTVEATLQILAAALRKGAEASLDLSQTRDFCVFSVVERGNDVLLLRHLKVFQQPTKYAHVLGYIKAVQDSWGGFEKIRVDFTRECPSIISDMETAGINNAEGVNFSLPRKIFRLMRNEELCGLIVYSYPPPAFYGRRLVLPRMTIQEMNKQLSIINRVVVHPKYRTIGLGAKLIRETLHLASTPYVEMIAVMAKYNPFAEKAGMRKIAEQQSVEHVSEVSKVPSKLGFDLHLKPRAVR